MNKKCQVFTPKEIVEKMLDIASYKKNLFGKRVLESACGEGNILTCIVRRYIEDCIKNNLSSDMIKWGLEEDIWGYDIDPECCEKTINRLNALANKYNIKKVQWRINVRDSLMICPIIKFDYIFGNPPYILYRELSVENRTSLKEIYESCSIGTFDYCYAFIEHDLSCLSNIGILVYLVPYSIFKNVYAAQLRRILLPELVKIYDFTKQKLFGSILTSSAIIACKKGEIEPKVIYSDVVNNFGIQINKAELGEGKWRFLSKEKNINKNKVRFSEFFSASIVIATLLNKAFIIRNATVIDDEIIFGQENIEKAIVKETVSPRSLKYNKKEYIIFPYYYNNGLKKYEEEEFKSKFPKAYDYLKGYYDALINRDSDKNAKWFEYGRSQALSSICEDKLLMSTVITNSVKVYKIPSSCIPYAGIFIRQIGDLSLDIAKDILESNEFYQYVKNIGIYANGDSIRLTVSDVMNYEFDIKEFGNEKT